MGQDQSKERKRGTPALNAESMARLRRLQERTKFTYEEAHSLYFLFKDTAGEKQGLSREEFQNVLGKLKEYRLSEFKSLPLGLQLFDIIDENHDGMIDLQEFFMGMSPLCKGNKNDKIELTFRVFDRDKNGYITRDELQQMYLNTYRCLMRTLRTSLTPPEFVDNPEANKFQDDLVRNLEQKFAKIMEGVSKSIMEHVSKQEEGRLNKDEFKEFVLANPFVKATYQLKFTRDGNSQPAYQDDEEITTEVLLSFIEVGNEG